MTPDAPAARKFYGKLLGWTFTEMPMGLGMSYTVFQAIGSGI
jgi:predicted enzyme related to lactoylglutathione lyase